MPYVTCEVIGQTAVVTLCEEGDGNVLHEGRINELRACIADTAKHDGLRAVCLQSSADAFCVGMDVTLASMVELINSKYRKRVITLEDPIEYMISNNNSMIEQREVGSDCTTFASGLKHVLRQDPDIIMVGEMRDLETTGSTITAAETGHLVFSTLHTINASQTIERIIDIYPAAQQNQIRTMLANTLQAVISQTLFRRVDEPGMVPCVEILLCTSAVRNCIRENRIYEIPNIIETSRRLGMLNLDNSIADMYHKGYIDREEAIMRSSNPGKMEKVLVPVGDFEVVQQVKK